jgi:DNA end-binding protein Ku
MPSRPISAGTISFGLVSIPVRLFTAASPKSVSFNLLHGKDNSRIRQKIYCPVDDKIIERDELVRGYEIEKGRYVTFTDEELKGLEARGGDHAIEISEFIPLSEVDPIYFEDSYYLGCEAGSAKAYRLLAEAMAESSRVALATFTMRGKEHLVLIRPHAKGLMLHTMYYADEIRSVDEVDRGLNAEAKPAELDLAKRLIADLTEKKFDPAKYHDNYRERVIEAAQRKQEGQQVTEAAPEERRGQVIDLMAALKASLEKRGVAAESAAAAQHKESADEAQAVSKAHAHASARRTPERKRASGGKK